MTMKVVLAEKPSVAQSIARIVGATHKKDGFFEGNGWQVTYAFGHLIQLAMPENYGYNSWSKSNLPMLPKEFLMIPRQKKEGKTYKNDPGVMKQLKIIKHLFEEADEIICATDSAREGEAIFRYIYNYLGIKKPVLRLWINSLTDAAIKDGFSNLQPDSNYDNLFLAAEARRRKTEGQPPIGLQKRRPAGRPSHLRTDKNTKGFRDCESPPFNI